jgi:predicted O-methyltransferase YrrM
MSRRLKQGIRLVGFAVRSPGIFTRALRDAAVLMLDRELRNSSRLPIAPNALMAPLSTVETTLPGSSCFVDGTQSIEGLRFLVALVKTLGACNVFEIGTFTGLTALTLAVNVPRLLVSTLDLPATRSPLLEVERNDLDYMPLHSRKRLFESRPEGARITQHEGDSAKFDFVGLGQKYDLVYIDGAHSYEYLANDTRAAFNIVSDSGAIVWDDYQPGWLGVVRYLNERTDLTLYAVPCTRLVLWLSEGAESKLRAT